MVVCSWASVLVCLCVSACWFFRLNCSLLTLFSFVTFCAKLFVCLFAFAFRFCVRFAFFSLLHAVIVSLLPLDLLLVFDVQYAYIHIRDCRFFSCNSFVEVVFFAALFGKLFFPLHFHFTRCNVFYVRVCLCVCVCAISSAFFFEMVWCFWILLFFCGKLFHFSMCFTQ